MTAIAAYLIGYNKAGLDNGALHDQIQQQRQHSESQQELIERLKREVAQLEQGRVIDQVAVDGVKTTLKDQQQEALELREEIAFYRGIVSPSEARTGIVIQRFELIPLAEESLFQYRLVLTQVLKNERVARGVVKVAIAGVKDGRSVQIPLKEVSEEAKKPLNFRFKYFQKFEGNLAVPAGFVPHSIEVEVKPRKSSSSISESFPWAPQQREAGL